MTRHVARAATSAACCGTAILLAGCAAPGTTVLDDIAQSTSIEKAVVFRDGPDAEAPAAGDLPMEQAVRRAVANDPALQAALARVREAQADAHQARLLPNPILAIDLRIPNEAGTNTAFEATITGDLVQLLQKPAQISAADKRLRGASADAVTAALDTMAGVQEAWITVAALDAQVANAQQRAVLLQQLRDIAQRRLNAGDATRLDVLSLDAELAAAALDLSDQQTQRRAAQLNLARLVGEARGDAAWPLELPAPPGEQSPESGTDAPWVDAALKRRPEIQSKLWELSALGDDMTAAEFSPFVGGEMGVHTERDPEWRTGPTITLPLPLFDMGQATREKIQAQRAGARHELFGEQEQIITDVRTAFSAYRYAEEALTQAQQKLVPLHQQLLDQARQAYQAGETDLATLLLAETDFSQTQSKVIDLRAEVLQARVKLQRAAGGAGVAQGLAADATRPAADGTPTPAAPTPTPATPRTTPATLPTPPATGSQP